MPAKAYMYNTNRHRHEKYENYNSPFYNNV